MKGYESAAVGVCALKQCLQALLSGVPSTARVGWTVGYQGSLRAQARMMSTAPATSDNCMGVCPQCVFYAGAALLASIFTLVHLQLQVACACLAGE
jgi:hypothetical protein